MTLSGASSLVELARLGVDNSYLITDPAHSTPVTFLRDVPAGRLSAVPSTESRRHPTCRCGPRTSDLDTVRSARLYWSTVAGLSEEPSRSAHFAAWDARGRAPLTVLDLDWRPRFWESPAVAGEQVRRALSARHRGGGHREECAVAVGETNPRKAADALLDLGVELAIVKQGPRGVLGKTRHSSVDGVAERGGRRQRPGGRGQFRGHAMPRAARRLAAGEDPALRERGGSPLSRRDWNARPPCRPPPRVAAIAEQTAEEAVNV